MNNVVHGLIAGQPLVDVGDDVDANVAEQVLGLVVSCLGETQEDQEREDFEHGEERNSAGELTPLSAGSTYKAQNFISPDFHKPRCSRGDSGFVTGRASREGQES